MKSKWLMCGLAMVCSVSALAGYSFEDVAVEYWAGQGANQAMIIVDFGGEHSYAFGYAWQASQSLTSYTALEAIDTAGDFAMVSHYDDGVGGMSIDSFSYDGQSMGFFDMALFASTDGQNWATSWVGASDRLLSNGDWDGWARGQWVETSPGWWDFSTTPTTPTMPAPEPTLVILLGLGSMFLRKRS